MRAVVATSALELGVDRGGVVTGIDVFVRGPVTVASWVPKTTNGGPRFDMRVVVPWCYTVR